MTRKKISVALASTAVLIILWEILSRITASSLILPPPGAVIRDCFTLFRDEGFIRNLAATSCRGFLAFGISFVLSVILGCLSGVFPLFAAALSPWMSLIKSTPVVSFILIAIFWFGSGFVPVFVAVLMTLPVMTEAVSRGMLSTDAKLLHMAHVYRLQKHKILLTIRIPSALPYLFAGAGASLGLTWKVVVAGEILGFPKAGIGTAMQTAKIHLETSRVFSLTLAAIMLSVLTDILFSYLSRLTSRYGRQNGEMA